MSQKRASEDSLAALHTKLAEDLADVITNGEILRDKDGAVVMGLNGPMREKASAAVLNVARQFLKDNDIKAIPSKETPLERLGQAVGNTQLPFEGEGEGARH